MAASKVVLVTGANGGLGYEAVKALLQSSRDYHILLGSRSVDKGKAAIARLREECPGAKNTLELVPIDLESDESIQTAFEQVKASPGRLDVLVNNAAVVLDTAFTAGHMSLRDSFTKAYDINVAGTQVVTWTFLPLLLQAPDPRLLFVSGLSHITLAAERYFPTPPVPAGWPKKIGFETIGYRATKMAINIVMLDWKHKLKEDGVKVFAVQPGLMTTNLGNAADTLQEMGAAHPREGAKLVREVVEGVRDADVGKLLAKDGGIMPW